MGINIGRLGPYLKGTIQRYEINSHLIGKKLEPMDSFQKSLVEEIDKSIKIAKPTQKEIIVYSGQGWLGKALDDSVSAKKIRECLSLKKGDTFTLPTYLSADSDTAPYIWRDLLFEEKPICLDIIIPKGSKLYSEKIDTISPMFERSEYVFPRNSKFKCLDHIVQKSETGLAARPIRSTHYITLEYIPPMETPQVKPTLGEKLKSLFTKSN